MHDIEAIQLHVPQNSWAPQPWRQANPTCSELLVGVAALLSHRDEVVANPTND
jgi:hypothetical protein